MASKTVHIVSGLDGQHLRTISVAKDTKIRDILMQLHQDGKGILDLRTLGDLLYLFCLCKVPYIRNLI